MDMDNDPFSAAETSNAMGTHSPISGLLLHTMDTKMSIVLTLTIIQPFRIGLILLEISYIHVQTKAIHRTISETVPIGAFFLSQK